MNEHFPEGAYTNVPGLCKIATHSEIEDQGWSLNPGRYVGVASDKSMEDIDFALRLEELAEQMEPLTAEAHKLESEIMDSLHSIMEGGNK